MAEGVGFLFLILNINLHGLFNAKAIFVEEHSTHGWGGGDKEVHTFPQGISQKINAKCDWSSNYAPGTLVD